MNIPTRLVSFARLRFRRCSMGYQVNQTQAGTYNTNTWTTNDYHAPVLSGGCQITPDTGN